MFLFRTRFFLSFVFHKINSFFISWDSPSEQVLFPVVSNWLPVPAFGAFMYNFYNFVHKHYDLLLQAFCSFSKLSDATDAEHHLGYLARST